MKVSCVFIVKYETQEIDTSIIDSFFQVHKFFMHYGCVCVCLDQCSFIMSIFFPTTLEMLLHCSLHSIFYDKKSTIDVNVDKSHNCEKL